MKTQGAVIAGASRGIGQAVAVTLARRGYRVVLLGRDADGLRKTARKCAGRAVPIPGDLTVDMQLLCAAVRRALPSIDILWLGAAGFSELPLRRQSDADVRDLIRAGYESQVELTRRLYPLLKRGGAKIIGACSDWSEFGSGGPSVFGSTKVALAGFLDKLRAEALTDGIRVTALKMGNAGNLEGFGLDDVQRQLRKSGRRLVSLRDICDAVEFIIDRRTAMVSELSIIPGE